MTTRTTLKIGSQLALILGALAPLATSGFTGMPLTEHPTMLLLNVALWIIGLVLGYRAFVLTQDFPADHPVWLRVCRFVTTGSATLLMLGMTFGFTYHQSIGTSFFGTNFTTVLMITLVVMGVQIAPSDWKAVAKDARVVSLVVLIRWLIMPLTGYCVSFVVFHLFLEPGIANSLAIGMMLLCTSPPGAASNSLTLLSKGDLALSVSATTINVLVAPFLQPLLIRFFVGGTASVDTMGMFLDLAGFVLAPVVLASIFGALFPGFVLRIKPVLGPLAVVSLACVLMGTISKGAETILGNLNVLPYVLVACVIQGLAGLTLGYVVPKYLGFTREQRIASSFEVGVENAAIAPALAATYFNPLAIVPAIVYGKTQNILAVTIFVRKFQKQHDELEQDRAAAAENRNS
ncbi:bile acid:sodium symporter family protein [Prauserella cavernicola]|uniref:Bile acid:sodium symporter family protein n=1 Tax=Prauserella cavernicola TaxID=2800127 RepID=A0A934QP36_9PSEU|nr:bile acid:sodium symporter family protein [Prauserella cavernicola]MBK1783481.1 bile acid:sodium symporter family protein [Prauserella cavernicola]